MVKRKHTSALDKALERLFCYYCEREFPFDKDLADHQRAMHFKCQHDPRSCNRKLQTGSGLKVHMEQVHKTELTEIPNCTIPGRERLEPDIFGMIGVPQHLLDKRRDEILKQFAMAEAEHMKKTGNSLSGNSEPNKKPKTVAISTDQKEAARAFKERKLLERKLKAEALARGEEPPVFDSPKQPTTASPSVSTPGPTATIAMQSSASPVAAYPAVSHSPAGGDSPYQYQQAPMALPHNAALPLPPQMPAYNKTGNYGPPTIGAYPMGPMHVSLPAPVHTGYVSAPPQPFQMTSRPAPEHDGERFREQYPRHGLPSMPPVQAPVPAAAPVHALPANPIATPSNKTAAGTNNIGESASNQSNQLSQPTNAQSDPQLNNISSVKTSSDSNIATGGMKMRDNSSQRQPILPKPVAAGESVQTQDNGPQAVIPKGAKHKRPLNPAGHIPRAPLMLGPSNHSIRRHLNNDCIIKSNARAKLVHGIATLFKRNGADGLSLMRRKAYLKAQSDAERQEAANRRAEIFLRYEALKAAREADVLVLYQWANNFCDTIKGSPTQQRLTDMETIMLTLGLGNPRYWTDVERIAVDCVRSTYTSMTGRVFGWGFL